MTETQGLRGKALFERIHDDFVGLETEYPLVTGESTRRIYLDSTASTLMMQAPFRMIGQFLEHYANTHSVMHYSAKIATQQYRWAHDRILSFVGADPEQYTCFFTGSGTTAGVNRMARVFRDLRPRRDRAIISIMEHHSNDLPHRKHMAEVIHIPVESLDERMMCVSLPELERALQENEGRVNYVSMTAVSNVTGIKNPVREVAHLAHRYGALVMIDGAQSVAHLVTEMCPAEDPEGWIDALVFSGHKTYMPGSPGVVIARKDHLSAIEPEEVGGGMVDRVLETKYVVKSDFPDREEAGTPNIPGAIALAGVIEVLDRIGMDLLEELEDELLEYALQEMLTIPEIVVYGDTDINKCPRAASISFNLRDMDHGLVAAILNDYYNVAVRNQCFCAHPYVKEMMIDDLEEKFGIINFLEMGSDFLMKAGMVRASFGLYSTREDVDELVRALKEITSKREFYAPLYKADEEGDYHHRTFDFDCNECFNVEASLNSILE